MPLRDLVFKDIWLKLFSLGLAVLIWVTVSFAIRKENEQQTGVFSYLPKKAITLPVLVVSAAADVREFRVHPDAVTVTVRGEQDDLDKLQDRDVRVTVDLTDITATSGARMPVTVSTPPGVVLVNVSPRTVDVVVPPTKIPAE